MTRCWILLLSLLSLACGEGAANGPDAEVSPSLPETPGALLASLPPGSPLPDRLELDGGLVVEILAHGGGPLCQRSDIVWLHVDVKVAATGQLVDSSRQRGAPIKFELGRSSMIKGLDRAVDGLRVGTVARALVPPSLAYGDRGDGGAIPPNAEILLELHVQRVR